MKPQRRIVIGSFAALASIVLVALAAPTFGALSPPGMQSSLCPTSTSTGTTMPPGTTTSSSGIIPPLPTSSSTTPTSAPPPPTTTRPTGNSTSDPCPTNTRGGGANNSTPPQGEADTPGFLFPAVVAGAGAAMFMARRRRE